MNTSSVISVESGTSTADSEFAFVQAMPKPKESRWSHYLKEVAALKAAQEKHGLMIPASLVHTVLDISRQRVHQLMDSGKIPYYLIGKQRYVPEEALVAHIKQMEGKGYHYNLPKSTGDAFKRALALGTSVFSKK